MAFADAFGDLDPVRAWAAVATALVVGVVGGSIAFPRAVYAGFVWRYFWGPVYADANGAYCAAWEGGARRLIASGPACDATEGIVAVRGYTIVNEVGYMAVLLLALIGVIFLLRRLEVGESPRFFFALFPFVLFGGALRVVEDAFDAARVAGVDPPLGYPANALLISPVIYFTVFGLTLAALLGALWLDRRGSVEGYERPLFAAGTTLLVATLGYLSVLAATTDYVSPHPTVLALTLVIATLGTAGTWWLATRYAPVVFAGTERIGLVVVWGHAVDGAANVLLLDWGQELELARRYSPKHPVNAAIDSFTRSVLPGLSETVGSVWPFFFVKLAAAAAVVWLFDERIVEESPRYAVLLLVAVLAVGLGPGSRDVLRAAFGV